MPTTEPPPQFAMVRIGEYTDIAALGYSVLVEPSKNGEMTRIHWKRIPRVQVKQLTKQTEKK